MTDDDTLTFKDVFRHDLVERDFVEFHNSKERKNKSRSLI